MENHIIVETSPEENEVVRHRVHALIEKWGTPQTFIARQSNINIVQFNQWFNNHIHLSNDQLQRIVEF